VQLNCAWTLCSASICFCVCCACRTALLTAEIQHLQKIVFDLFDTYRVDKDKEKIAKVKVWVMQVTVLRLVVISTCHNEQPRLNSVLQA